ncbi:organic cation transporter protein [Aethina tumida]|uniref:organic cation transporter protein n=1 Tax=Aethina tumida TaxID=116153 RepID=UPI00096B4B9C|nr:organic cation transporter protein [Aethina tumida]
MAEDPVIKNVGEWGKFQLLFVIYIFLSKFSVAQHQISIIFLAPKTVDFKCAGANDSDIGQCLENCDGYEYNTEIFTSTIITEWDLVCERSNLANVAQTITMFGILCGNMLAGYVSDRFGRKYPLATCILLQTVAGSLASISPNFYVFCFLKFVSTVGTGGQMVVSFVIMVEWLTQKKRGILGALYQLPFNLGHLSLPGFSYLFRDWRVYQFSFSITTLPLITYYCFLPESARWYLTKGKKDKAVKTLTKATKCNGNPTDTIEDDCEKFIAGYVGVKRENLTALCSHKIMAFYTAGICFNWFICGFCYFGVSQYVGTLGGNIFANNAIAALLGIPGTIIVIFTSNSWGRKGTTLAMNAFAAIPLIVLLGCPEDPEWIQPLFASLSMFGIFGLFCIAYIFAGELFPTTARNAGLGLCSLTARMAAMIAPYVQNLSSYDPRIPAAIYAVMPIIGFVVTMFLPETLNAELPSNVEESENFKRKGLFK